MKKYISEMIIKKYEGSKAYKDGKNDGNMSIDIYEKEKKILNDPYKLKKFNETIRELMKYDLIKVTWVDKNNIADKIHFNLKNIDKFYEMSGIEKKDTLLENTLISIEVVKNNITQYWIIDYLNSLIDEAKSKRNRPKVIEQKGENLFNSLLGIDDVMKNEDTMLERLFSKKYLKNSKEFEKTMRGTIVSIIRKFNKDIDPELEEAEILELVGIEKTNNDLHIKGNMKIRLNSEIIDLGKMVYGTSLNKETLRNLEIVECSATKVISIENKANFLTEAKTSTSEELLIFSSGFFSPIEKQFLLQIKDFYNNRGKGTAVEYYHSGDYDFGGFNIFVFIKNNIFENLKPFKMSKQLFLENIEFAEDMPNKAYVEKIAGLLDRKEYEEFHDIIKEILRTGRILEQEALLFG